jgi:hypothetical protein
VDFTQEVDDFGLGWVHPGIMAVASAGVPWLHRAPTEGRCGLPVRGSGETGELRGQDEKAILPQATDSKTGVIPAKANLDGPRVLE